MKIALPVILGSRSPRRLELLRSVVPEDLLRVCPPQESREAGFDGLTTLDAIERRVREIVAVKRDDVIAQVVSSLTPRQPAIERFAGFQEVLIVVADTTVVVPTGSGSDEWTTLGQPPDGDEWQGVVRDWFCNYLAGRTHVVMSGVSVARVNLRVEQRELLVLEEVCRTRVTMRDDAANWIEWYLQTGEPLGKAGGYAIQGAGSVFVTRVDGSLSNVIGLPLEVAVPMLLRLADADSNPAV